MKILHVIPGLTLERGGVSAVVHALVHHQAEAGHRVTVLTTDQWARRGEHMLKLPRSVTVGKAAVWGPDRVAYAPDFGFLFRRHVRANEIVHLHSMFTYPVDVALREALAAGVPVVLQPHGMLHRYSLRRSRWRKKLYLALRGGMVRRACAAWHYTSANEAAESWPWDSSPRFVLPNGVEPAAYALDPGEARETLRRHWPELTDSSYVLFLGRLHPKKRLDLLLAAFLAGAPRPFKLVVAGPDECSLWEPLAARFLRDPAAAGRVLRVEMVSGDRKAALLAGASLFALPSEHENFGVAALEALAAGTPVLLSPQVDLADAVVAAGLGETAALEVGAWTERLTTLLGNTGGLSEAAERRRRWVKEQYSWSQIARELEQRYRWVMAGCPADAP